MTKIKNFRIALRSREVARLLKSQAKLQITPELEASIDHSINDCKRLLQSAAVYTTLTRTTAEKATPLPLVDPAVAVSAIAVTIGSSLDEEIANVSERQETVQAALLSALREEALQQAVQFIMRLIEAQAKDEECEMSTPRDVTDGVLLASLGALLGTSRIGMDLSAENASLPPHARLVWTVWSPKARVKAAAKAAATAVAESRAKTAGRAEKAAV
jgi:hypothetical protein